MALSLYPPAPQDVPEGLTKPSDAFRARVWLVLLALVAFFLSYAALICLSVALMVLSVFTCVGIPFIGLPSLLLFLYLVKGFFRKETPSKTFRVEVTAEEHPKLFEFIEELCAETQAPRPHKVYLSPEVNAAVFYHDSVMSLLIPPRKNLLLGMGLVNVLNLSEFKAVLAHEFGHFSQKSMSLDRYVYVATRIMSDMAHGRDWFDNMVEWMKSQHHGFFVIIGWTAYGSIWIFRKILEACIRGIQALGASLSRQMEFNADLVAVRSAGSDAIVQALYRIPFASESLDQALSDLRVAGDHGLLTADLFYHQNHAMTYLRRIRKKPKLGEPPALPDDPELSPDVFEEDDLTVPDMYASHPPSYDREQNAKKIYLRVDLDERSPWLLFDEPVDLRERLSRRFYKLVVGLRRDEDLDDPKKVQQFIDDEHAETTYDPRYHGAYDNRPINPGDVAALESKVKSEPWKPEVLARVLQRFYGDELKSRMKEITLLREEYEIVKNIRTGKHTDDGTFRFRGKRYDEADAKRLAKKIDKEMDEEFEWLADMDARVFRAHYQMAREIGTKTAADLSYRYHFHMTLQDIDRELTIQKPRLEEALDILNSSGGKLDADDFAEVKSAFRKAHDALDWCITQADKWTVPTLKNMPDDIIFGHFLLDRKVVKSLRPGASRITAKWINGFLKQLDEVQGRVRRLHFKSVGGILTLQEQIARRWQKDNAGMEVI